VISSSLTREGKGQLDGSRTKKEKPKQKGGKKEKEREKEKGTLSFSKLRRLEGKMKPRSTWAAAFF